MGGDETYRLPRSARPRRYELELAPDLDAARFDGQVTIDVELVESADRLVLHAADLGISSATLATPEGDEMALDVSFVVADQMLVLSAPRALEVGRYRLSITFEGTINDQLRGFYRSTFRDDEGVEHTVAVTQFEASDARRAFPCWDEPDFKAVFAVRLVIAEGLTAISNGELLSSVGLPDGRVELTFADTMSMSTYLVAFVVGPYELTEPDVVDGTPMRIAAPRGRLNHVGFAAGAARHALEFLSGYFGIPYPGGKLDHVAVPDFAFGAMENLGCVTYRDRLLLVDESNAAQTELQNAATVIAHETAHMWFGNLVTMKWWNGIWLNEAFATFMELTTSHDFRPEWQVWTAFGAGKAAALSIDGLRATRPVEYPVGRPEEAEGMFDVLTYQKGGSVLRMLEQFLGPEVFRQGIARYLATHAYANTETQDLWDALEEVSGQPVRTMMATWILQGGYPVVHAARGDDPSTVVLRQERFFYSPGDDPDADGPTRWVIPVSLRASVDGRPVTARVLLDGPEISHTFSAPVDWVVVNDGAWGYYRTRYDADLLDRLRATDPVTIMSPLERLQVVGDIWAAVVAGTADLSEWVSASTAVAGDPDPDVWGSLGSVLRSLLLLADDRDRPAVAAFTRRLAGPAGRLIGWEPVAGEGDRVSIARARILSALGDTGGDTDTVAEALRRYETHLARASVAHDVILADQAGAALAPDLIRTAAAIAVANGGERLWDLTLNAYRSAEQAVEQLRYLYALAETPDAALRRRVLDLVLSGEVRSQDGPFLVGAALSHPGAANQVWEWMEEHWAAVSERFPPSLTIRMFESTAAISDADLAGRVHRFFDRVVLAVSPIRLQQILERMDLSVALAERLRPGLAAALA